MRSVLSATNFINRFFLFGLTAPNPSGTRNHLCEALNSGLASGGSGLQLNLEIALSGVSAKVKPFNRFQAGRKCVEASDDVIENDLTTSADSRK